MRWLSTKVLVGFHLQEDRMVTFFITRSSMSLDDVVSHLRYFSILQILQLINKEQFGFQSNDYVL